MYATIEQFQAHIGALRLAGMSGLDEGQQPEFYVSLLLAATSRMNGVFARSGYVVPLQLEQIENEDLRAQLRAQLAIHCTTLAAWSMLVGLTGAAEGLKLAHDNTASWLKGIQDGTEELLGLTKEEKQSRTGGRVGVVLGNDDLDRTMRALDRFQGMGRWR